MKHANSRITAPFDPAELEEKLGYKFKNRNLLMTALSHSSYSNELKARGVQVKCNERLEFLGDSVLSIVTSEHLFENFPLLPEGELTKIRAAVVCEKALHKYSQKIGLGDYLLLGHGEEHTNGRSRPSILADAFEAVLAAIYLDCDGNLDRVKTYLLPFVCEEIDEVVSRASSTDNKTKLQQIVQMAEGEVLEYVLVGESGPDHNKTFEVEARLNSNVIGRGKGHSKREAEQLAAKEALSLFGE